jgi:hypothetical protein
MDERKYERERLKQNRLERLVGSVGRDCFVCREAAPNILEAHHIAGRRFSDDQITACLNHHRKLTDRQNEHPPVIRGKPPSPAERMGRLLLGIADCLEQIKVPEILIELVRRCGTELIEAVDLFGPSPRAAKP